MISFLDEHFIFSCKKYGVWYYYSRWGIEYALASAHSFIRESTFYFEIKKRKEKQKELQEIQRIIKSKIYP